MGIFCNGVSFYMYRRGSEEAYLEDITLNSGNARGEEEESDDSGSAVEGSSGATVIPPLATF